MRFVHNNEDYVFVSSSKSSNLGYFRGNSPTNAGMDFIVPLDAVNKGINQAIQDGTSTVNI